MCSSSSSARLVSTIDPADHDPLLQVFMSVHTSIQAACHKSSYDMFQQWCRCFCQLIHKVSTHSPGICVGALQLTSATHACIGRRTLAVSTKHTMQSLSSHHAQYLCRPAHNSLYSTHHHFVFGTQNSSQTMLPALLAVTSQEAATLL